MMNIFRSLLYMVLLCSIFIKSNSKGLKKIGVAIPVLYFFFIMAFRGDFTTDYSSYVHIFDFFNSSTASVFWPVQYKVFYVEFGFALLNFLVSRITDDPQVLFVLIAAVIALSYYKYSKQTEQKIAYLVLVLVFGTIFQSFNLTRQMLSVAICLFGYEHLYEGDLKKYLAWILLAGTVHVTALIMLPMYFLFRMKQSPLKLLGIIVVAAVCIVGADYFINLFDVLFKDGKYQTYGDDGLEVTFNALVVPMAVTLFIAYTSLTKSGSKSLCKEESPSDPAEKRNLFKKLAIRDSINFTGTVVWLLCQILSLSFYYCYRLQYYFAIFAMFGTLDGIKKINVRYQKYVSFGIIAMLCIYYLFFGPYYGEYEFCF